MPQFHGRCHPLNACISEGITGELSHSQCCGTMVVRINEYLWGCSCKNVCAFISMSAALMFFNLVITVSGKLMVLAALIATAQAERGWDCGHDESTIHL